MKRATLWLTGFALACFVVSVHAGPAYAGETEEAAVLAAPEAADSSAGQAVEGDVAEAGASPAEAGPALGETPAASQPAMAEPTDYSKIWRVLNMMHYFMKEGFRLALVTPSYPPMGVHPGMQRPTMPTPPTAPTKPMPSRDKMVSVRPERPVASVEAPAPAPTQPSPPVPATAPAPEPKPAAVRMVGRPGRIHIFDKAGNRTNVDLREVTFRNQPGFRLSDMPLRTSPLAIEREYVPELMEGKSRDAEAVPKNEQPEVENETPASDSAEDTAPKTEENGTPEKSAEEQAESAEQAAAKAAAEERAREAKDKDIAEVKRLRKDGAWFFNPDGSPMTHEQLDARLASGDIEGITSVTRYQERWATQKSYEPEEGSG